MTSAKKQTQGEAVVKTPWNAPRLLIAFFSFVSICVTGLAVGAADPLQQMMKLNGAYSEIEDPQKRMAVISRVVGYGFSWCLLTGVLVGPLLELVGTKITALLGILMHSGGYLCMFFTSSSIAYYVAGFLFGFGFQCILNSHMSTGCLFPKCPNLVLAILGAAPDISLFLPPALLKYARELSGEGVVQNVVLRYLLYFAVPAAILDLLFVPWRPFVTGGTNLCAVSEDADKLDATEAKSRRKLSNVVTKAEAKVRNEKHTNETSSLVVRLSDIDGEPKPATNVPIYQHLTLSQQLATPDYWIFVAFAVIAVIRKKYTATALRFMLEELDLDSTKPTATFYMTMYNFAVPYGFVPAIIWGALVDHVGILNLMFASNLTAVIYTAVALIPCIHLQGVTVVMFIIYQSFILGQTFSFCASVYGFHTLASLQGIATTSFGFCSLVMDAFIYPYITETLRSHWKANLGILVISVVAFVFPLLLLLLQRSRVKRNPQVFSAQEDLEKSDIFNDLTNDSDDGQDALNSVFPITTCYERRSLQVMHERRSESH